MTASPNTPGRPAEFSRESAIDAAMNLFWRAGVQGVSVSDLAAAMKIQRSSFYNSFGNREAVFMEALERYAEQSPDRVLDGLSTGDPVVPALVGLFRDLCHLRTADPEARGCLICNSIGELVGVDDRLRQVLQTAIDRRIESIRRALRQAIEQGELPAQLDVSTTAHAMIAFLLGINLLSKTVRDEQALWAPCRQFLLGLGIPSHAIDP